MILCSATPKPRLILVFAAILALPLSMTACSKPTEEVTQATIDSAQIDAQLMASGQWRDPATNMIWMRCSLGQTWTGSTCTGEASKHDFQAAQDAVADMNSNGGFAGHTDWVVPHIEDLSSIRYCSTGFTDTIEIPAKVGGTKTIDWYCKGEDYQRPTLDTRIFPNTPDDWYWSASPYAGGKSGAWLVGFDSGAGSDYKYNSYHVRAVRAGQ